MAIKKNIIRLAKGVMWQMKKGLIGGRKHVQSLDEGLEILADCGCGIKCCDGQEALRLPARDSEIIYEIYASGGQLVLKNTSDDSTTNITALPSA